MLSVGQGDTTVIISPEGHVIIIDAMRASKILSLLDDLGNDDVIEHLVITHPHADHYGGANGLAREKKIVEATVAPFWHEFGMGPSTYRKLIGRFDEKNTNVTFLSGYDRWYPDGVMKTPEHGDDSVINPNVPYIEMVGPTNGLVRMLEDSNIFEANHLSIMCRLSWRNFRMIIAGDAQMENWAFFDDERMMEKKCQVLRTAHHGSANGTQWERIHRLSPSQLIVSSDPAISDKLPDLCGTSIFTRFNSDDNAFAAITKDTGTIHMRVTTSGSRTFSMFRELPAEKVDLTNAKSLSRSTNPTDWLALLNDRAQAL